MITSVAIGVVAAALLKIVYQIARVSWPENYFDSSRRSSSWFFDHPFRVGAWRVIPYVLTLLLVIAVSKLLGVSVNAAAAALLVAHMLTTNVLAIIADSVQGNQVQRQAAYASILGLVLLSITWMMVGFADLVWIFVPNADSVISGLWSAIFVGIGFAAFKLLTLVPSETDENKGGIRYINHHYFGKAVKESYICSVDPLLTVAVLEVEAQNRKKVHRVVELLVFRWRLGRSLTATATWGKLKSARTGVLNPGTFGVGQADVREWLVSMYSSGLRVSLADVDLKSIEAVAATLSGCVARRGYSKLSSVEVKSHANKVNSSSEFVSSVAKVYEELYNYYSPQVEWPDGGHGDCRLPGRSVRFGEPLIVRSPWLIRFNNESFLVVSLGSAVGESIALEFRDEQNSVSRLDLMTSKLSGSSFIAPLMLEGSCLAIDLKILGSPPGSFLIYDDCDSDVMVSLFSD